MLTIFVLIFYAIWLFNINRKLKEYEKKMGIIIRELCDMHEHEYGVIPDSLKHDYYRQLSLDSRGATLEAKPAEDAKEVEYAE